MSKPQHHTEEEKRDYYKALKENLRKVVYGSDHKDAGDHPSKHRRIQK